jgi:hypothetical protein
MQKEDDDDVFFSGATLCVCGGGGSVFELGPLSTLARNKLDRFPLFPFSARRVDRISAGSANNIECVTWKLDLVCQTRRHRSLMTHSEFLGLCVLLQGLNWTPGASCKLSPFARKVATKIGNLAPAYIKVLTSFSDSLQIGPLMGKALNFMPEKSIKRLSKAVQIYILKKLINVPIFIVRSYLLTAFKPMSYKKH